MELSQYSFEKSSEKIMRALMLDVVKNGAESIHIEPDVYGIKIRYRVDGVMYDILEIPAEFQDSITVYIKEQSGMNPLSSEAPQEGKLTLPGGQLFLVSTLPVLYGERFVMHLVRHTLIEMGLTGLGFSPDGSEMIMKILKASGGLFVISGSLGDGRSTTALSILRELARRGMRCVSLENAPTYEIREIRQVRCEGAIELMRMLEEMRSQTCDALLVDEAVSSFAMKSVCSHALEGRLVIAVSRSRNALTMLRDMMNMGIERQQLARILLGILAQKLVRKVCPDCRISYNPHPWELRLFESQKESISGAFSRGTGCERCRNSGYSGRAPIEQLIVMDEMLRETIVSVKDPGEIDSNVIPDIAESGRRKCLEGLTTLQEVIKVLDI